MSILDILFEDLEWREGEIASIKIVIHRDGISDNQRLVLLRAAWALLYAHYEGYTKFCLDVFFDQVCAHAQDCVSLPPKTLQFAIEEDVKKIRHCSAERFVDEAKNFILGRLSSRPTFPQVDAKSNLSPDVLCQLLEAADLDSTICQKRKNKLRSLVFRRNAITHGDRDFISDFSYYSEYEAEVRDYMYELTGAVVERLERAPYTAPQIEC